MADQVARREQMSRDPGFTLIELMVAMGLFAVFLVIFTAGMAKLADVSGDTRVDASSSSAIGVAMQKVQRSIRYADSVNYPGSGAASTTTYVEWHTAAQSSSTGVTMCTQLRYDSTTGVISMRSWAASASPSTAVWAAILSGVTGAATTSYPFSTIAAAGGVSNYQGLALSVSVGVDSGAGTTTASTFYARNSSVNSPSNAQATTGQSAVPICTGTGQRP